MSKIRNNPRVSLCLTILVAGGGCAITNALEDGEGVDDSETIEYPDTGINGLNLLAPNLMVATRDANHSIRAELGEAASVRIQISETGSIDLSVATSPQSFGWSVSLQEDAASVFIALEGHENPDIRVRPDSEGDIDPGPGKLLIEYFENGDVTPTFTKMMTIDPPEL